MIGLRCLRRGDPAPRTGHYIKAACKGVIKIMSKMGVSTVARIPVRKIFEAVGLARDRSTSTHRHREPYRWGRTDVLAVRWLNAIHGHLAQPTSRPIANGNRGELPVAP